MTAALGRLPGPLGAPALLRELRDAAPGDAERLAERLLHATAHLGNPSATFKPLQRLRRCGAERIVDAIAKRWADYSPPARQRLASRIGLGPLARVAERDCERDTASRAVALALVCSIPDARMATPAARLALDEDPAVAAPAAAALFTLTRRFGTAGDASVLDQAVAHLLEHADGRTPADALAAGLLLAGRPGPAVAGVLCEDGHPSHLLLRGAARKDPRPELRAMAIDWLRCDALAPAAVELLCDRQRPEAMQAGLERAHLLLDPVRRRRTRRSGNRATLMEIPPDLSLSEVARRGWLRWIDALPLRAQRRTELLTSAASDGSPAVRLLAAHRLAETPRPDASVRDALGLFAADEDVRIARVAIDELTGPGDPGAPAFIKRAAQAASGPLREEAAAARRRIRYLEPAPHDPLEDLVEARLALARDRERTVERIRRAASTGAPGARMRAIRVAGRLGLIDDLELELLAALGDEDARLAATAAGALAGARGGSVEQGLRAALEHRVGRVRANALESLAQRAGTWDQLLAHRSDPVARVRANAVHGLLRLHGERAASEDLASMLRDRRPGHRVSAIWVASRLGGDDWTAPIATLAREDEAPRVRESAQRCARRLLARIRAREGLRPAPVAAG